MNEPTAANNPSPTPTWERATLEKLAFAALREQRAARRWRIFFRLVSFSLIVFVVFMLMRGYAERSSVSVPHTALIKVQGVIAGDSSTNAQAVIQSLRAAFEEPSAKGVLLLINSPGGSPVQAGLIADEIHRLRALHDKPVHAVIEEVGASAAYYVASAATSIHVNPSSLVGSIGVMMNGFGFTELMDKLGVERRLLTAGANKGFMDPFSPSDPAQVRHTQAMLDDIHQQFIGVVRKGRGERLRETPETFSGLIWSGQRAVDKGLADALGSVDSVARDVIGAKTIIDYTQRESVAQQLARRLGTGAGEAAWHALQNGTWSWR